MNLLLKHLEQSAHLPKYVHSGLNHKVVNGRWVLVTTPHDSLELESDLHEMRSILTKNVSKQATVVDNF